MVYVLHVLCEYLTHEWIPLTICYERERRTEREQDVMIYKMCFACVENSQQHSSLMLLLVLWKIGGEVMSYFLSQKNSMVLIICFEVITTRHRFRICSHLICLHSAAGSSGE